MSFLFQALTILVCTNGFRKGLSLFVKYPALVLMSTFSFWTVGSADQQSKCCCPGSSRGKIMISYKNSWINVAITVCGIGIIVTFVKKHDYLLYLIISGPPLVFSIICFILVQTCPQSKANCCQSFNTNCCPLSHRTVMNIEDEQEPQDEKME